MKFEKFLKMTAGRGVIVDREDGENEEIAGMIFDEDYFSDKINERK